MSNENHPSLEPATRRMIVAVLGAIAILCIVVEGLLTVYAHTTSDALLAITSVAVGALAGVMLPDRG